MIERDRELLTRLAAVNRTLGAVVVELMQRRSGGELPADPVREIGDAFARLGEDCQARADELDGYVGGVPVVEGGAGER